MALFVRVSASFWALNVRASYAGYGFPAWTKGNRNTRHLRRLLTQPHIRTASRRECSRRKHPRSSQLESFSSSLAAKSEKKRMFSQANENVSYWYSNCLFIPYLGHCAKLQAIINKSATDPRAADKLWLVVIDDDTIMRWFSMELSTVLDKTDEKFRTSSSPNRGWENGASWLSRRFILDFRGRGFTPPFYSVLDCSCV